MPERVKQSRSIGRAFARSIIAVAAMAMIIVTIAAAFAPEAFAQEKKRRWFSLRDLFAPRVERNAPRVLSDPSQLPRVKAQRAKQAKKKRRSAPREPEIAVRQKAPDARIVLVIGDFLGSALADGLSVAYAENPNITVLDRTRGSSGFVRQNIYDWPAEIGALVEKEKPAVILVMLGSNDRQQMRIGETREPARSTNWNKEYQTRADGLARSLAATKVPFAWFGLPAFKSAKMSDDMLAFNDIYRAATESVSGQFIDVWDGFVDESGAFVSTGPDVSGQPVRLRANDGINFTRAGKRKLAFYAEKPIAKILGLSATGGPAGISALPEIKVDPDAPMPVDRTVPISLDDPALDGGAVLLGAEPLSDAAKSTAARMTFGDVAGKSSPGRADDFGGAAQLAAPAPALLPAAEDQATAATR